MQKLKAYHCSWVWEEAASILNSLSIFQTATVFASEMGLKVTVEDAKCIQANAFIQEGIFQQYTIKDEQLTFKINLTVLLVSEFIWL